MKLEEDNSPPKKELDITTLKIPLAIILIIISIYFEKDWLLLLGVIMAIAQIEVEIGNLKIKL